MIKFIMEAMKNDIKFIKGAMKNCSVELTAGGRTLVEVKIQTGIFQGDAL